MLKFTRTAALPLLLWALVITVQSVFINPSKATWCVIVFSIYAVTIFDVTVGLPFKNSLKRRFPGVQWFDCVVYFLPFGAMMWLSTTKTTSPWIMIFGFPLLFAWGIYFMARLPILTRGATAPASSFALPQETVEGTKSGALKYGLVLMGCGFGMLATSAILGNADWLYRNTPFPVNWAVYELFQRYWLNQIAVVPVLAGVSLVGGAISRRWKTPR